ncbi:glycoside hydrolase family 31 protein [Clostridium pasteurianum]|uniref:Family 31 glycosyl hydrolase, alpha-glucosidase n=1 Tax=Clostridium pasteurianum BC1 TaxID=86416 RepID=R4KAB9_CLOPA|nr:glycoside hydrolase family 31 protein [Clostridium pasteurianum]AGK98646.1 family 31 glycosyl hydrolase, alpha-glucosidase [Clostridium pasteurianum BC1]
MFGKIIGFEQVDNKIHIGFEEQNVIVEIISASIINFFSPLKREQRLSKAVEDLKVQKCSFSVDSKEDKIIIATDKLNVNIFDDFKVDIYDDSWNILCEDYRGDRKPFVRRGVDGGWAVAAEEGHELKDGDNKLRVQVLKKMEEDMYFYGFGEKTGHLNKKGYHYKMWNTDDPKPHVESFEALYKSIPFFIGLKEKQAFGIFFDNTFESHFDIGKENSDYYYFGAVDGNLDYYFIYGPSMKEVVNRYTDLTGRTPLPQLWTLGYQQCRWAYVPEQRLMEIAKEFRNRDIPCDALYLDIDYMDGYRVFTWDKNKFPNPKEMLSELKQNGFKVVTIIDPGVKKDKGYEIYDKGIKNGYFAADKDNIPYVNKVWPGDALYPDFPNEKVRNWWAENQKIMMDYGVSGIWNDMNEPASFNGPLPDDVVFNNDGIITDHREMHNVFGHYMSKATYEGIKKYTNKRPFVITRACYAGTQKYSTVWTGDNQSLWEHLRMSLPMLMNLGLSGITFCGTDVGGFGFDCTAELLSRWVQVGCFTPLFRNHSSIMTRDQEPWAFDKQTEDINRKYIKLRYKLIPYLYDTLWKQKSSGLPLIRPLMLHYQEDENTYEINDEFLCGENILVAPVIEQGKTARMVYLPKGSNWVDYWTKEVFQGGKYIVKEAPLDLCPVYIKQGTIIPNYPVQNYIGEKKIEELTLDIYPAADDTEIKYVHYQDDGESFEYRKGVYNLYEFLIKGSDDLKGIAIRINKTYRAYRDSYHSFKFKINNIKPAEILADGKAIEFKIVEGAIEFLVESETEIYIK